MDLLTLPLISYILVFLFIYNSFDAMAESRIRQFLTDPKFLLLDEPFVGIDPLAVADLQSVVVSLKSRGIGILITDHNVRETLEIVDRGYILYEGQVRVEGTAQEILANPDARKFYLGDKFSL